MSDSFGARLRRRREEQGIALVTIAQDTKIKLSLLEGLERDDVTQWPSGIFRRAYVRAYAHAIGLGPDTIVREFLETHPDPEEVIAAAMAQAAERAEANASGARLRHIMGSALGSLSRLRRPGAASQPCVELPAAAETFATAEDVPLPDVPAPEVVVAIEERVNAIPPPEDMQAPPPAPVPLPAAAQPERPPAGIDYAAVAQLCTDFARVDSPEQAHAVLGEATRILDATGAIVWISDNMVGELRPTLSFGYSAKVLAQIPPVTPDDDNVTAAAFRSAQLCTVSGSADSTGALAVPLPTPAGCGGVLALELEHGGEQAPAVRAIATILAALLGQLLGDRRTGQTEIRITAAPQPPAAIPFRVMARR